MASAWATSPRVKGCNLRSNSNSAKLKLVTLHFDIVHGPSPFVHDNAAIGPLKKSNLMGIAHSRYAVATSMPKSLVCGIGRPNIKLPFCGPECFCPPYNLGVSGGLHTSVVHFLTDLYLTDITLELDVGISIFTERWKGAVI